MPNQSESFVGLFIDWDNLAISTAVDFAGAVPDVRAIVKAAQRFGTVLVARAYAEWNVSSERLAVYRAGIEPVYAPTFRFESESNPSGSRGKSLADPCLVTDCIDTLHLMPEINVFVLVSGDKDLIPIVRLAQLRGKRVTVIGPDFAAAILRDMADEYIPYRQLAESSENPPTEVSVHGTRSHRRTATPSRAVSVPTAAPARVPAPARVSPMAAAPSPLPPEPNGADHPIAPAAPETAITPPSPAEEVLDAAPLFAVVSSILREREESGKPRLRATNLKDQLLARISGFNERKYGFARFKDLLAAAEKAGVIEVTRTGPVQWVTSASQASSAPVAAEPAPVPSANGTPGVTEPVEAPTSEPESVDREVVEFIIGLRERSRWLTYTYVLTNLLNHLGNGAADAASDAEARVTLNRLVQAGVLQVDREPREIDVNGTRHRVRLCHVVDEHPLVRDVLAEMKASPEPEAIAETPSDVALPTAADVSTVEAVPAWTAEPGEPSGPLEVVAALVQPVGETSAEAEAAAPVAISAGTAEVEANRDTPPVEAALTPAETQPSATEATVEVSGHAEATGPIDGLPQSGQAVEANGSPTGPISDQPSGTPAAPSVPKLTLAESFSVLRDVIRDATDANRPTTGPAAVKNRLVRRLGAFDEREYGFSKFKDYLISAERAGAIRLEMSGATTRVALATDPEPAAE